MIWFSAGSDLSCRWRFASGAFWSKSPARAWPSPTHT